MSQVQIRQIPGTSQDFAGSWFPSGYYGHFRAKSRADLCNQFRQLARPEPPTKFNYRQNSESTTHMFSQHDNRFKFENDPLVRGTQAGFGRRRTKGTARGEFDPLFISWIPKNVDLKKFNEDTKKTSYANDYNDSSTSSQILSDIQTVLSSNVPESEISVYSKTYSHGQPNCEQAKKIRQETFQRYATTQKHRFEVQQNDRSFNVASCLVWNTQEQKTKNNLQSSICKSRLNFNNKTSPKLYQSQSMTTVREHYNPKVFPSIRSSSSFETTHSTSVESLISKYM